MDKKTKHETELSNVTENKKTHFLFTQYQVIASNRVNHNELLWNVQLVFLTAQSFLLIIALRGFSVGYIESAIGGFIGFVFGILCIQAFERDRAMEIADAELLLKIEEHLIDSKYIGLKIHNKLETYNYLDGTSVLDVLEKKKIMNFFSRGISYHVWKCGMWLTTFVAFSLFLYNTFMFSFASSIGKFLWYDSFDVFKSSFDRSALGAIVIILALNWIFYMVDMLQEQQPKKYTEGSSSEKIDQVKAQAKEQKRKAQKSLYSLEALLLLVAFAYTILAYYKVLVFIPYMWLGVLFACIGLLIKYYQVMLREIRETIQKAKKKVEATHSK